MTRQGCVRVSLRAAPGSRVAAMTHSHGIGSTASSRLSDSERCGFLLSFISACLLGVYHGVLQARKHLDGGHPSRKPSFILRLAQSGDCTVATRVFWITHAADSRETCRGAAGGRGGPTGPPARSSLSARLQRRCYFLSDRAQSVLAY